MLSCGTLLLWQIHLSLSLYSVYLKCIVHPPTHYIQTKYTVCCSLCCSTPRAGACQKEKENRVASECSVV